MWRIEAPNIGLNWMRGKTPAHLLDRPLGGHNVDLLKQFKGAMISWLL